MNKENEKFYFAPVGRHPETKEIIYEKRPAVPENDFMEALTGYPNRSLSRRQFMKAAALAALAGGASLTAYLSGRESSKEAVAATPQKPVLAPKATFTPEPEEQKAELVFATEEEKQEFEQVSLFFETTHDEEHPGLEFVMEEPVNKPNDKPEIVRPGPEILAGYSLPVRGMTRRKLGGGPNYCRHWDGIKAVDIFASCGTDALAVTSGVAHTVNYPLGGYCVVLKGNDGRWYYYAHLKNQGRVKGKVEAGQRIGYVYKSGSARTTPCHLHFAVDESWDFNRPSISAHKFLEKIGLDIDC